MAISGLATHAGETARSWLSPFNDLITYILPEFGASLFGAQPLLKGEEDPSLNLLLSKSERKKIAKEIKTIQKTMKLGIQVIPYFSFSPKFDHFGGSASFGNPILHLPYTQLVRNQEYGVFGKEKKSEALQKNQWFFTDLQTKFCIIRELTFLQKNTDLAKTILKIILFVSIAIALEIPALGLVLALPLFISAFLLHRILTHISEKNLDQEAIAVLTKMGVNPLDATRCAIECLEKMKTQNIYRRKRSKISRIFLNADGSERFCIATLSLNSRIHQLKKRIYFLTSKKSLPFSKSPYNFL